MIYTRRVPTTGPGGATQSVAPCPGWLCDKHVRHIEWASLEPRLLQLLQQPAPVAPTGELVAATIQEDPDLVVGKLLALEGRGHVTSAPDTAAPRERHWWWVT